MDENKTENNVVENNESGNVSTEEVKSTQGNANQEEKTNQEETSKEQNNNTQEEVKQENQLTLESYGDLGLVETEDMKFNKDLQDKFKQIALENKISPEVANKIAKLKYDAAVDEINKVKEIHNKWQEELKSTYGENLKNVETNIGRVLAEFDKDGKFKELLTLTGGTINAPVTWAFLKNIGDKLLEKPSINPNTNSIIKDDKELSDYYNN